MWQAVILTAILAVFTVAFITTMTLVGLGAGDRQGGRQHAPAESPAPVLVVPQPPGVALAP
jgi:hypothetical protein